MKILTDRPYQQNIALTTVQSLLIILVGIHFAKILLSKPLNQCRGSPSCPQDIAAQVGIHSTFGRTPLGIPWVALRTRLESITSSLACNRFQHQRTTSEANQIGGRPHTANTKTGQTHIHSGCIIHRFAALPLVNSVAFYQTQARYPTDRGSEYIPQRAFPDLFMCQI